MDEDEEVGYGFDELDRLTHAYAVSIHRSQGGEYRVWSCLTMSAWMMLQRNLLYTAVTEADKSWYWSAATRPGQSGPDPGAGRRYTALNGSGRDEPGLPQRLAERRSPQGSGTCLTDSRPGEPRSQYDVLTGYLCRHEPRSLSTGLPGVPP